ncbi:HEAT repeat domain-containing protein [Nostoc sp. FACHB-152]|uniref:HEAT repeat domain-containing protein n=1 Tax=Nostoc sp. FACHB-152 TaxID=2692837 RepID=UPI0016840C24|nr:HEAT repeat domain-containing protein [Nostoc sp. FACHB-152]MBD2452002.1 HEAT repeat domain-containing protein [Nostoc sp. FACHB-152]
MVLTCRLNVWDAQVNNTLTGFDTYKTQEFKPEQIDEFIHQWFERAGSLPKGKTLQDKLKAPQHENIRKLVTNPLRLSLLCQTFYLDNQGELPETKAALYDRFTRYFYGWKSELFSELCNSDDLKDELHQALSKLAFAGINSSARFRLRRSLARQEMGERLFKLACDVGWLNLVDRVAETDEEVYAFFHPNFQEYFAALKVNDWHEFLNHLPHNPAQGTYRIFEPQWREVILLWFGQREKKLKQQQQDFVNALVNFKDGCGSWDREDIDKGFYEYQAFFLAAVVIAEFKDCSQADEIVKKIVTWGCGNFKDVIENEAQTTLQQTNPTKAIAALVQLLQSKDVDYSTRGQAADSLEKIGTGNQDAIAALVQLLQSSNVDYFIRIQAVSILGKIGAGNQDVIAAAVMGLLQSSDVDEDIRKQAAASLGEIGTGNQDAITALVQLLQSSDVHYFFRMQVASSLGKIGTGNQDVITALVQLLQSSDVDEDIRKQAAASLGEIGTGNQDAITALVQLLQLSRVDEYTRRQAVYSLGNISTGNQDAIMALVQLLQSSDVDKNTCRQAIKSLRKIGIGNQDVIATLVQLLQSSDVDKDIRRQAADSLGKIGTGNQEAIAALVQLLQSKDVDNDTRRQAASSLGEIGTGNQDAIAALVQLLQSNDVDKSTRRRAADSLGEIDPGNQDAIAALVQLLQSNDVDEDTRRRAASSLGKVIQDNQHRSFAVAGLKDSLQFDDNYKVIWECSQNMPYPDFYQAWHQRNCEEISHNHLDLPQGLQAAIKNDPQLSQNIHLICIDTSKFIDPDNPASKIYTAIVKAGYLKCPDGTPTTMAELQTYWELLETNKRVVLVFHPGAANTTSEATYSKAFLNAITKFEGAICFISDPIPNYNTLKVFTPNQSVDDILEWLQPSR